MNQTIKGVAGAFLAQIIKNKLSQTLPEFRIFDSSCPVQGVSFQMVYNLIYKLFRKAQIEPECIIASVEYCDEFQRISGQMLKASNYQRLIFVSILIASKVWDDVSCSSKSFALCTSEMSLRELNEMERTFCKILNFELFLDSGDYRDYYYDMKRIWLSLQVSKDLDIKGWQDVQVQQVQSETNWITWGIDQLKCQAISGDIKQVKQINNLQ
ncbi:Cyclin_fold protein [Hexamita inflata]|uniref:Cyclin fold protein n=1 Tax=Hexamita inflata TaxID=28002 RepID=A0AA86NZG7_9EUKA|nr:Cyclin fold protein [Hexamita inflata]